MDHKAHFESTDTATEFNYLTEINATYVVFFFNISNMCSKYMLHSTISFFKEGIQDDVSFNSNNNSELFYSNSLSSKYMHTFLY